MNYQFNSFIRAFKSLSELLIINIQSRSFFNP